MVESFKQSEIAEVDAMRTMRDRNMEKHRQEDGADVRFCLCRKSASGLMIQCELCKDWFHGTYNFSLLHTICCGCVQSFFGFMLISCYQ